jgi:hypothetical protein
MTQKFNVLLIFESMNIWQKMYQLQIILKISGTGEHFCDKHFLPITVGERGPSFSSSGIMGSSPIWDMLYSSVWVETLRRADPPPPAGQRSCAKRLKVSTIPELIQNLEQAGWSSV